MLKCSNYGDYNIWHIYECGTYHEIVGKEMRTQFFPSMQPYGYKVVIMHA
jgi:hypothetical protein